MYGEEKELHPLLLRILVTPALRFCLKHAISFRSVSLAIKKRFLELATEELERNNEKVTLTRLHIMTGIDRREVTKIKRGERLSAYAPHPARKVVNQWEQDPAFLTRTGRPKTLSYKGDNSEFTRLVAAVSAELNPAAMLAELERMEVATISPGGVRLTGQKGGANYINPDRMLGLLARNIETLTDAVEANINLPNEKRHFHIRTEYDNLYVEDLEVIRARIAKEGGAFHKKLRTFLFQHDGDLTPEPDKVAGGRAVVCSFAWVEPEAAEDIK